MEMESLIFDVDGTLWDSTGLVAQAWNRGLREQGLEVPELTAARLQGLFGRTMTEISDQLLPQFPAPERYRRMERCFAYEAETLRRDPCRIFYPGVVETLRRLHETHRLFIVSNCQTGYIELLIRKGGLEDCISDHLCFGETGRSKAENIRAVMSRNRVLRGVYVGDTQMDCTAAALAGIPFIWAAYGFGTADRWDWKLSCFSELTNLF